MKKSQVGLMVFGFLFVILFSFGQSWAQNPTMLIVVRADDDSLWKMTCDEGSCSSFESFPGLFRYQPTVSWDEATQEWVVVGTAADNSIWMATFNKQGVFNDDWQSLPGLTPSPAGVSSSLYKLGGDIKTDRWLNSNTNTFIGVGVAGAGNLTHTTYDDGWYNTAFGYASLYNITTGINNTAIGNQAGRDQTTGSGNIYIGHDVYGIAGELNVIRIGNEQTQTYIAGINGIGIGTGSAVYVNSNGQLGVAASSRRFKEDIKDMGEASSRLMDLRPVTFRYKNEIVKEDRTLQYGLIAEEVAEVYPELVQYEKEGEPFTVRYHELGPMLLNEVQRQHGHIEKQNELAQRQQEQIEKLHQALEEKDVRIQRLEKLLEAVQERMALIESPTSRIASK